MKNIGLVLLHVDLSSTQVRDLKQLLAEVERRLRPFAKAKMFAMHLGDVTAPLGLPDDNRGYLDGTFWRVLEHARGGMGWNHVIGVTTAYLEVASFNRQNPERTCGIISTSEWRRFVPVGLDLSDYLTYLVLCVATLQCAPITFEEHRVSENCLFDLCEDRDQLKPCLAHASARHCEERLTTLVGWNKAQVDLLERTLKTIKRRNLYLAATGAGDALPFVAGVALSLAGSVLAGLVPRVGAVIAGALVGTSLWLAAGIVVSKRLIGRVKSRLASTLALATLAGLGLGGAVIGLTVHIPQVVTVHVDRHGIGTVKVGR